MAVIKEDLLKSVSPIGIKDNTNKICWCATCFFVASKNIKIDTYDLPFLVTNRHVIKNQKTIIIRTKSKGKTDYSDCEISLYDGDKPLYFVHDCSDVDLVVLPLPIEFLKIEYDFSCYDIDSFSLSTEELLQRGGSIGTFISMLGYPLGLVNNESQTPICRLGCIARIDKTEIQKDHCYIIDIQNFPGNSGSPVLVRPELSHLVGTKNIMQTNLIGIVYGYIPYSVQLLNLQSNQVEEIRSENSGLAKVIPVEYIRDIIYSHYPIKK